MRSRGRGRRWHKGGGWQLLGVLALIGGLAVAVEALERLREEELTGTIRVVDGDSLVIDDERVRLEGIDAPELGQRCRAGGSEYDCGARARAALVDMVSAGAVTCTTRGRDRYGRHLAECRAGELHLNAEMVRRGWAVAYGRHERLERSARQAGIGLWAGEFERPQEWRVMRGGLVEEVAAWRWSLGDLIRRLTE